MRKKEIKRLRELQDKWEQANEKSRSICDAMEILQDVLTELENNSASIEKEIDKMRK
jgi:CHAD domain-containing protein